MVTNGNIPDSQLVTGIQGWAKLWPSTAAKFAAMNADLVAHGYPLMIITTLDWAGAYRDIPLQKLMKKEYGAGAATPGYSNHGLGRAWDINNISHYPTGVIPAYAKKHGLLIDAGNGHGGIESWHMHDADGITPASSDATPIPPVQTKRTNDMATLYHDASTCDSKGVVIPGTTLFALAGDSPGTQANWMETKDYDFVKTLATAHGPSSLLGHASFLSWKAAYQSPVRTIAG